MQTPPFTPVSTLTPTTASTSTITTTQPTPTSSSSSQPRTQPSTGILHTLRQMLNRSRPSQASDMALTERSPQLPHPGPLGDHKAETQATKEVKSDVTTYPATLADVWADHAFSDGPGKALCQTLLAQRGKWNAPALVKRMPRLTGEALVEFGEFAARLQDRTAVRHGSTLVRQLTTGLGTDDWPVVGRPGVPLGRVDGLDALHSGLARGLILTKQNWLDLLKTSHYARRSVVCTVMDLQDNLWDADLSRAMEELHRLRLPYTEGVLARCRELAQSSEFPLASLHRLVRWASSYPVEGGLHCEPWHADWLRILETPPADEPAISPERHFVVGHAVGSHRNYYHQSHSLVLLRLALDGIHHPKVPEDLPAPQPTAFARAGARWALDPFACLAALPSEPDGMRHAQAWAALPEHVRKVDPVRWHSAIEALDIPPVDRLFLQQIVPLPSATDSKVTRDIKSSPGQTEPGKGKYPWVRPPRQVSMLHPQAAVDDHRGDSKATQDTQPVKTKASTSLAEIWPDHVFVNRQREALCQTLLAHQGRWHAVVFSTKLDELNDDALAEFGEFAAYLRAHLSVAEAGALMEMLMEVLPKLMQPFYAACYSREAEATNHRTSWRMSQLVCGITRGLILSGQIEALHQFFAHQTLAYVNSVPFIGLVDLVVQMHERLPDESLENILSRVLQFKHMFPREMLEHLHALARDPSSPPAALDRLALAASASYLAIGQPALRDWLRVLENPRDDKAAIPTERQFVIGHGVGAACRAKAATPSLGLTQNADDVRSFLDGKHGPPRPTKPYDRDDRHRSEPLPNPTAASRAGALWGLDPLACVARLSRDPACAHHIDTWIACKAPMKDIDPVAWYRTVEDIDIPFAQRHRLQRLMLGRGDHFSTVRASLLPPAGEGADDEIATAVGRLTDLYRYFGERDGLEFAFAEAPDFARIRQEQARVRERITAIEQALHELQALAPAASTSETAAQAFLREGLAQVAQVTLGASLKALQANLALALGEASSSETTLSPQVPPDGKATKDGKGD